MSRLYRCSRFVFLAGLAGFLLGAASGQQEGGCRFEILLAELRPDYHLYVGSIRPGPLRTHPSHLYMGLVRPGGSDPTNLRDAPLMGHRVQNDIIVYEDSQERGRSNGWALLLIDHEYFHARHLARGDQTPFPSFGDPAIDRHFFEAAAWGYNLSQAEAGTYTTLTHADYREAFRTYSFHFEAFRDYVLRHDRPAWAHYRRFLPDPEKFEPMVLARN